jgi:hypothetical protein
MATSRKKTATRSKARTGTRKRKTTSKKGNSIVRKISTRAKSIYRTGSMAWTAAIKKASAQLKKEGII